MCETECMHIAELQRQIVALFKRNAELQLEVDVDLRCFHHRKEITDLNLGHLALKRAYDDLLKELDQHKTITKDLEDRNKALIDQLYRIKNGSIYG